MTTVGIYTRLSQDKTGEQTATHRQQAACEAFAQLRGWDVVRVFEDVDLSAYNRSVVRPAYEEMLLAIKAKRIDGVVAWKLDRFVRRSAEFERLWETCEKSDVFLTTAMEPIDTSTDLGLALVRVLVAFASLESATSRSARHLFGRAVGATRAPTAPLVHATPWDRALIHLVP